MPRRSCEGAGRGRSAKPELLAPAGDETCLRAALHAGCDAVYLGVEGFNMRASARNFRSDRLKNAASLCSEYGARLYLTLNTMVYGSELERVRALLERVADSVDAVICWDAAVMEMCRELTVPFHVSTQASVSNAAAAAHYRQFGASRVIPARECTLEEIAAIRRLSGLEVEVFVHGAMCASVSGRCFLSQAAFGQSANRGECLQNCRREYLIRDVADNHEFVLGRDYVMSARDLCAMPFLDRILDAGVDALKIEGRGRSPEYVDTVVRCYRAAVDDWHDGELTAERKEAYIADLKTVFNRGFSSGFYLGRPVRDWSREYGSQATYRKAYVGRVLNYYKQAQVAHVRVESEPFREGDRLLIQGKTSGVVRLQPTGMRQEETDVERVRRGTVTFRVPQRVREGDRVYVMVRRRL